MSLFVFKLRNLTEGEIYLQQDPEGWDKTHLRLKRSALYSGIFHEYTFALDFTKLSGKSYIDNIYETQGIKASVEIDILYDCNASGNYKMLFPGKLNLSKINRTRDTVSVNIEARNLSQALLNREDVKVDLKKLVGLDGGTLNAYTFANYDINLHSRALLFQARFQELVVPKNYQQSFAAANTPPDPMVTSQTRNIFIQSSFPLIQNELRDTNTVSPLKEKIAGSVFDADILPFYIANDPYIDYPQTYHVDWDIAGVWTDAISPTNDRQCSSFTLTLAYGSDIQHANFITLCAPGGYTTSSASFTKNFSGTNNVAFNLNPGDKVWVYWFLGQYVATSGGATSDVLFTQTYNAFDLKLYANTATPVVVAKGFALFEAWSRLLESITGANNVLDSIYFGRKDSEPTAYTENGCGAFTAILDAMDVRGFTDRSASISLTDMFASCNAIFNIGLGVESVNGVDKIKIEDKAFFYDKSKVMLHLDYIEDLEMTLDLEKFYNLVEIGYAKWEPENINGLDEFNSKHYYTNEISSNKSTLSLLSPFVASGMALETTKRAGKAATKDTKYDNDTFIVALNRETTLGVPVHMDTPEIDENYTTVNNVLNVETVYNLRFSPKRNMLRHLNVLGGAISRVSGDTYKFQKGEGNFILETDMHTDVCSDDYNSVLLDEDIDLAWNDANADLNVPLWIPELYTFNYKLSSSEYSGIRDSDGGPTGVIVFNEDGVTNKSGYLIDLDFDLQNGMAKFTLLRAY